MDAPNELVYFKVTNVEHDVPADVSLDAFCGSQLGEWGCWVDHSRTRIIQTGVEQSRIPASQGMAHHSMFRLCYVWAYLMRTFQSMPRPPCSRSFVRS